MSRSTKMSQLATAVFYCRKRIIPTRQGVTGCRCNLLTRRKFTPLSLLTMKPFPRSIETQEVLFGFACPPTPHRGAPRLRISGAVCFSAVSGPAAAAPQLPECWIQILRKSSINFKPVSRAAKIRKMFPRLLKNMLKSIPKS